MNRQRRASLWLLVATMVSGVIASSVGACSNADSASPQETRDSGTDDATLGATDAGDSSPQVDAPLGVSDGSADAEAAAPVVNGLAITSANGAPLEGAPGDAIQLVVLLTMSDGTSVPAPDGQVTWLAPVTLSAEDPYDAGPDILPEAGAQPTAFFVQNSYRQDNLGVLYITDPGTVSNPTVVVKALVTDAGEASATVSILPAPVGDAASGGNLFLYAPGCGICHGMTGGGSPQALLDDGGPELIDGGPAYAISGQFYPYPAPGLNNAPDSGNLASDPAWNAALLGMAAQSDMDNQGVALRQPMPDWFGGTNTTGGTLRGQDFADIYAWLKTQTK